MKIMKNQYRNIKEYGTTNGTFTENCLMINGIGTDRNLIANSPGQILPGIEFFENAAKSGR